MFHLRTRHAVSAYLHQEKARWKRSTGTFPKSKYSKRETGRSGLVRSALEKLSLFSPTFPVRQKHGAGNFAVCGQRLRGHVPSKNTSPAALSWSSLTNSTAPVPCVSARCFLSQRNSPTISQVYSPPHFSLFQANFAILETGEESPQKGWLL